MKKQFLLLFTILLTIKIFSLDTEVDKWLNSEITDKLFIEYLTREVSLAEDPYEKSIYHLYLGQVYFNNERKKDSIKELEVAIDYADSALREKESADLWRVKSEAGSIIMLQKGVSYIIRNSKKVNEYALKSVAIDNNNIKAQIIIANGLINAPKVFGGNLELGLKQLNQLTSSIIISREDKFNCFIALSTAYKRDKKNRLAEEMCKKALEIYPENLRAKELLSSI
jgi:tetratricopeptide (TPR) repeat protein